MHPSLKLTQYAFIGFTVSQIGVFLLTDWYAALQPGFDRPGDTPVFKLIGIREIGLMAMYLAATYYSYVNFTLFTIVLRATALPFILAQILLWNAGWSALGGVVQDYLFGGIALYFARKGAHGFVRYPLESPTRENFYHVMCRIAVTVAGTFDLGNGLDIMLSPRTATILDENFEGHQYMGIRAVGYITLLMGIYQVFTGVMGGAPAQFYLAVGFYHLVFYMLGNEVYGHLFDVPGPHLGFGFIIFWLAFWAIEEERSDVLNKLRVIGFRPRSLDDDDADAMFYLSDEDDEDDDE